MTETPTSSPPGTRWGLKAKVILSTLLVGVIPLSRYFEDDIAEDKYPVINGMIKVYK